MKAKQHQVKLWKKSRYDSPHNTKLSELWSRAGIIEDTVALRIFRLEMHFTK